MVTVTLSGCRDEAASRHYEVEVRFWTIQKRFPRANTTAASISAMRVNA